MPISMKDIQDVFDDLSRFRPARLNLSVKRNFSLREAVLFMAPKLTEMKAMGGTTKELEAILANRGIVIKVPTLNRYLNEYRGQQ